MFEQVWKHHSYKVDIFNGRPTVRSLDCNTWQGVVSTDRDGNVLCEQCHHLRGSDAFRSALRRANDTQRLEATTTNVRYMSEITMVKRLKTKQSNTRVTKKKNNRLRSRSEELYKLPPTKEELRKYANRIRVFAPQLTVSKEQGKQKTVLAIAADLIKNILNAGRRANTYGPESMNVAALIRASAGPRLYTRLESIMNLPTIRYVEQHIARMPVHVFLPGMCSNNWENVARIYTMAMEKIGIPRGSVLTLIAEDETSVVAKAQWDSRSDQIVGYCGAACENKCETVKICRKEGVCPQVHSCDTNLANQEWRRPLGGDDQKNGATYDRMKNVHDTMRVAPMMKAVVINPMHKDLVPMVVMLTGTCNAVTTDIHVKQQWKDEGDWYKVHLAETLGPQVGRSTDGDSRRRRRMINDASDSGTFMGLNTPTFTYRIATEIDGNRVVYRRYVPDTDWIHGAKKLINSCASPARELMIGPGNYCHLGRVRVVMNSMNRAEHGMLKDDDLRTAWRAMDWPSVTRLISSRHLKCLDTIINGNEASPPDASMSATKLYLSVIRRYVGMFASKQDTLSIRVKSAGYVITFLRLWRQWVKNTTGLTLQKHFITREAFQDIALSCHAFVLMLMFHRDKAPDHPATPWKMGSNCVEDLFASLGGMVMHKRVYTIMEATQTVSTQNRINSFTRMLNGAAKRPNRRMDESWDEAPRTSGEIANLLVTSTDDEMRMDWLAGVTEAYAEATAKGMKPTNAQEWWTHPEQGESKEKEFAEQEEDAKAEEEGNEQSAAHNDEHEDNNRGDRVDEDKGTDDNKEDGTLKEDDHEHARLEAIASVANAVHEDLRMQTKVWVAAQEAFVHKGLIMAHLSEAKKLSSDRTIRYLTVREGEGEKGTTAKLGEHEWLVGLEESVAVKVAVTSTCGQTSITILPAKVFRIRKANTLSKGEPSGWTEYYRPIKLPEARKESIYLHAQYYTKIKGTTNRFELSVNDPGVFHAAAIVCPLSMTYTRGSKGQHVYQITEEAEDVMRQAAKGAKEWVEVVPSKINAKRQRDEKQDKDHRHHVYAVAGQIQEGDPEVWLYIKTQPSKKRVQYLQQNVKSNLWSLLSVTEHEPLRELEMHQWKDVEFHEYEGKLTTVKKFDPKIMTELKGMCKERKHGTSSSGDIDKIAKGTKNGMGKVKETCDSTENANDEKKEGEQVIATGPPVTRATKAAAQRGNRYTAERLLQQLNSKIVKVSANGSCWLYSVLACFGLYIHHGHEGPARDAAKRENMLRQWVHDWMEAHTPKYTKKQAARFHEVLQAPVYSNEELIKPGSWGQAEQIMGLCALFDAECVVYSKPNLAEPNAHITVILKVNDEWELEYRKAEQLAAYVRQTNVRIIHIMYNGTNHYDAITCASKEENELAHNPPELTKDLQEVMKSPCGGKLLPSVALRLAPANINGQFAV